MLDQKACRIPRISHSISTHVPPYFSIRSWFKNNIFNQFFWCDKGKISFYKIKVATQICPENTYLYFDKRYYSQVDFNLPEENVCVTNKGNNYKVENILLSSILTDEKLLKLDNEYLEFVGVGVKFMAFCALSKLEFDVSVNENLDLSFDGNVLTSQNIEFYCDKFCLIDNGIDLFNLEFVFEQKPKAVTCKNNQVLETKEKETYFSLKLFCRSKLLFYYNKMFEKIIVKQDTFKCVQNMNDICERLSDEIISDTNQNYIAPKNGEKYTLTCEKNKYLNVHLSCDLESPDNLKNNREDYLKSCSGLSF